MKAGVRGYVRKGKVCVMLLVLPGAPPCDGWWLRLDGCVEPRNVESAEHKHEQIQERGGETSDDQSRRNADTQHWFDIPRPRPITGRDKNVYEEEVRCE